MSKQQFGLKYTYIDFMFINYGRYRQSDQYCHAKLKMFSLDI